MRGVSNGELWASFSGSHLQSPKSEADEGIDPEEGRRPPKDRLHPLPSQPPLPGRLLTFQSLNLLEAERKACGWQCQETPTHPG